MDITKVWQLIPKCDYELIIYLLDGNGFVVGSRWFISDYQYHTYFTKIVCINCIICISIYVLHTIIGIRKVHSRYVTCISTSVSISRHSIYAAVSVSDQYLCGISGGHVALVQHGDLLRWPAEDRHSLLLSASQGSVLSE